MKQARAFGLSIMPATQNPIDLDYKSLSNAGTWFIGRLQTKQDVNRAKENLRTLNAKLQELQNSFQEEVDSFTEKSDISTEEFEKVLIRPKKSNIDITLVSLLFIFTLYLYRFYSYIDITLVSLLWAPYKNENGTLEKSF